MQFARVTNQIFLGSVAFTVSFCLSLFVNRDIKQALTTGSMTVPATYAGVVIIHNRRINQDKLLRNSLQNEIQELEEYKTDINQFLFDALAEEEEVEASINALQAELNYIRTKLTEGYTQRKEQTWELGLIQSQKQQQEADIYSLQEEIKGFENQIKELNQVELEKKLDIRKIESEIDLLKVELSRLKIEFTDQQTVKAALEQEVANFKKEKYQLLEEKRTTEDNLNYLKLELIQLQAQIAEQQNEKKALEQGLFHFEEQRRQLEEALHNLKVPIPLPSAAPPPTQTTELPNEWTKFMKRLPQYEFLVLQAIAEQDNPNVTIKKIAEEKLTMPELLIDSINERAIDIIGDLIIDPGSSSVPRIIDEYLTSVKQLIKNYV
jgi:chromosome segregation ATPase